MLRDYTDGEIDLFKLPKVHEIARFQQNSAINDRQSISFSDAGIIFSANGWLSHFLKNEFPDIEIPSYNIDGILRHDRYYPQTEPHSGESDESTTADTVSEEYETEPTAYY
jgi:hypothetical protein